MCVCVCVRVCVCVSAGIWGLVLDFINDFQIKQYSVPLSITANHICPFDYSCPNNLSRKKKITRDIFIVQCRIFYTFLAICLFHACVL